jgi:hypothetical protein
VSCVSTLFGCVLNDQVLKADLIITSLDKAAVDEVRATWLLEAPKRWLNMLVWHAHEQVREFTKGKMVDVWLNVHGQGPNASCLTVGRGCFS